MARPAATSCRYASSPRLGLESGDGLGKAFALVRPLRAGAMLPASLRHAEQSGRLRGAARPSGQTGDPSQGAGDVPAVSAFAQESQTLRVMPRRAVEIALVVPEDGQIAQLVAGALLVAEAVQRQPFLDSGDAPLHVAQLRLGQPDIAEGVGQPGLIAGLLQERDGLLADREGLLEPALGRGDEVEQVEDIAAPNVRSCSREIARPRCPNASARSVHRGPRPGCRRQRAPRRATGRWPGVSRCNACSSQRIPSPQVSLDKPEQEQRRGELQAFSGVPCSESQLRAARRLGCSSSSRSHHRRWSGPSRSASACSARCQTPRRVAPPDRLLVAAGRELFQAELSHGLEHQVARFGVLAPPGAAGSRRRARRHRRGRRVRGDGRWVAGPGVRVAGRLLLATPPPWDPASRIPLPPA